MIDCKASTPNIPYADSFYTQTRYCITWAGPEQTRISICLGITWLKSPFVKSIIKSAAHKAFEETCMDYMACLRQEIAAKIGTTAASGELVTTQISTDSGIKELTHSDHQNDPDALSDGKESNQDIFKKMLNPSKLIELVSEHKIQISIFIFAFLVGRYFGFGRTSPATDPFISSYDLELDVMREMNVSKIPTSSISRSWINQKFQRTHSQLNNLHGDFATIRKSIWLTIKRVNELERRVYKAELAALLGDRLLACYDQKESPACLHLQEQWKSLLKEK